MLTSKQARTWSSSSPISPDRKSTRLNSSHLVISYAVFCLKKKKKDIDISNSNQLSLLDLLIKEGSVHTPCATVPPTLSPSTPTPHIFSISHPSLIHHLVL